jgi:hypothetical protein
MFLGRMRGGSRGLCVGLALAGVTLIGLGSVAQATEIPYRTTSCSISKVWHRLGPSYVEILSVSAASCETGETLVTAYNSCRLRSGGVTGHCRAKVDGFMCAEERYTGSPDQFIAKVSCARASRTVHFTYTENT